MASSKPQVNKPVKRISSRASSQHSHLKKKPVRWFSDDEDEDEKTLSMIRRMFNTQRFTGRDDGDSDMEANFDDIMKEERRRLGLLADWGLDVIFLIPFIRATKFTKTHIDLGVMKLTPALVLHCSSFMCQIFTICTSMEIAGKEDGDQLRLIEEEEQRKRMRKLAEKRKLSH